MSQRNEAEHLSRDLVFDVAVGLKFPVYTSGVLGPAFERFCFTFGLTNNDGAAVARLVVS